MRETSFLKKEMPKDLASRTMSIARKQSSYERGSSSRSAMAAAMSARWVGVKAQVSDMQLSDVFTPSLVLAAEISLEAHALAA